MRTKSEIFKQAHQLAKTFDGNYSACLSEALKIVWYDTLKIKSCNLDSETIQYLKSNLKTSLLPDNSKIYSAFLTDYQKAETLKDYSYRYWDVPFTGHTMFFNEHFVNHINR